MESADKLGDEFYLLFRAGWLAYINVTYAAGPARPATSYVGQDQKVVDDELFFILLVYLSSASFCTFFTIYY